MSQGTLYTGSFARGFLAKGLVQHLGLDVAVVDKSTDAAFASKFPLGKIPAFVGPKGFKLTESIAVYSYRMFIYVCPGGYRTLLRVLFAMMRKFYLNHTVIPVLINHVDEYNLKKTKHTPTRSVPYYSPFFDDNDQVY